MSLPTTIAKKTAGQLLSRRGQNIITQTDARHILQEVGEDRANYPKFDPLLTEKSTHIAYTLIACGCSIIENEENPTDIDEGLSLLEKAGKTLSDIYEHNSTNGTDKAYNLLLAGMSLFAAKQYSRAFVVLNRVDVDFTVGQIIISFIRKDLSRLIEQTNKAYFSAIPDDESIYAIDEWVISHEVARCFMVATHYVYSGNGNALTSIHELLDKLLDIASEDGMTLYWLIIRLLKILFSSFISASLWTALPPFLPQSDLRDAYIRLLGTAKTPVTEIWPSQIESLDKALGDNAGAVINLRTSGGKTRVAELAMLQTLTANPNSKVLYLAPFRSLAFELEKSLSDVFIPLGFAVTHLYGNATVNLSDFELIEKSNIVIATPEKAKAIIRGSSGIESNIKLVVVDEGHLLGDENRYIRNELFLSHIKETASRNGVRVILLSAVLPNADDLAKWITDDSTLVAKSDWKPSLERTGLLLWDGSRVRLEWNSDGKPFNPSFIQKKPLGFGRRRKAFPADKNEAVAATALRMAANGTVMIFSARAISIKGLAEAVLLAMGQNPPDFDWDTPAWTPFESLCIEELEADSIILKAARKGVICHSNKLTPNVRISIEKLMRSKHPLIIIASSTLGQGVNVGISTVIVNSPYYSDEPINVSDFWNICGRAGRAYSDAEGKVLYAIDTKISKTRTARQVEKDKRLAASYFQSGAMKDVRSGLVVALRFICHTADKAGVAFDRLLELLANDFSSNEFDTETIQKFKAILDLIDDGLLAMHIDFSISPDSLDWAESVLKKSLAIIQAEKTEKNKFVSMLSARIEWLISRTPSTVERQRLVSTGIPFSVAQAIISDKEKLRKFGEHVVSARVNGSLTPIILAKYIAAIEKWVAKNALTLLEDNPIAQSTLNSIREDWISGVELSTITEKAKDADRAVKDYYGFTLPWVLHAMSQVFDGAEDEEIIKAFSTIALLVELGLPNEIAANIFLAGVRSRSAAVEMSSLGCLGGKSAFEIKIELITMPESDKNTLSENAKNWLKGVMDTYKSIQTRQLSFPRFEFDVDGKNISELLAREYQGTYYLVAPDGSYQSAIKPNGIPFDKIANRRSLYFALEDSGWALNSYNPRVSINTE
jgi:hypothetical protein